MRRLWLCVLLFCSLVSGCAPAPVRGLTFDPRVRLLYLTKPAVAWVSCTASVRWQLNQQLVAQFKLQSSELTIRLGQVAGSGFAVDPSGLVVTNAHVVQWCAKDDMALVEEAYPRLLGQLGQWAGHQTVTREEIAGKVQPVPQRDLKVGLSGGDTHPALIKEPLGNSDRDQGKDIALLKINVQDLQTLRLGLSHTVPEYTAIVAVGYPAAAESEVWDPHSKPPTYTNGIVSAHRQTVSGAEYLQVSAQAAPGSSGSPVVKEDGSVMGMITLGSSTSGGQDLESFNFVTPSDTIADFLGKANGSNLPGRLDQAYNVALDDMAAGRFNDAIDLLELVLRIYPKHPTAGELLKQARDAAAATPVDRVPWRLWIGAGLLGAALLGSILMLIFGRRHRRVDFAASMPLPETDWRPDAASVEDGDTTMEIERPPGSLVFQAGPLAGQRFPIAPGGVMIGRGAGCDVVIADPRVSKHHVWVGPSGQGRTVELIDRGSRNGTYLSHAGGPLRLTDKAILYPGDRVCLVPDGTLGFTYELP